MTDQIKIERADFADALHAAASASNHRTPEPLLACALLRAAPGATAATVTGTDLSTVVTTEVAAEVTSAGPVAIALPLRELAKAVQVFPAGPLVLEVGVDGTPAKCALAPAASPRDRYRFMALPARNYPALPEVPAKLQEVDCRDLRRILETCRPAAAHDDTRPHLQSVFLAQHTDTAGRRVTVAVATDGHRMHVATAPLVLEGWPEGAIVPMRAVDALLKLLEDKAQVGHRKGWIFLRSGAATVAAKLADLLYPPWEQVMPPAQPRTVEVDARALAAAAARVALVATDSKGARLRLQGGALTLEASAEGREMAAEVHVPSSTGVVLDVMLNARYLGAALEAMDQETVVLQPGAALAPFLLASTTGACSTVVMPMRDT